MIGHKVVFVVLSIALWGQCQQEDSGQALKLAAFNVRIFGETKFSNKQVVATLSQIVQRYDVILIQEIRDSSETVIHSFLDVVNSDCSSDVSYGLSVSERLGRTSSKEQYAFMYRTDKIEVPLEYQYEDDGDLFEREPFCVLIKSEVQGSPDFFLVAIHTKPTEAVEEINALDDVYRQASLFFGTENGIILGDFNADCSYLSRTEYKQLDLVTDSRFTWLIDTTADTTTSDSYCAYDRIVVSGEIGSYIPISSVGVFQFDTEYGLTFEECLEVSDHYPVELQVAGEIVPNNEPVPKEADKTQRYLDLIGPGLKVAAFNVRVFGVTKYEKKNIVDTLSQIVQRYDVILIQEIRDSSEMVIQSFVDDVNSDCPSDVSYGLSVSERLGRTSSKEQYAFMYRTDKVEVLSVFQDSDASDVFEREPYCVLLKSTRLDVPDFFLIAIHTKPTEAVKEINALDDVYRQASLFFGTENGIILGDFNADCSYLSRTEYKQLDLVTDSRFTWLIDTTADTTTSDSHCAYDRIVVSGEIGSYIPISSVGVFQFDTEYGLTFEECLEVSDHYPVEFRLFSTDQLKSYNDYQQQSAKDEL